MGKEGQKEINFPLKIGEILVFVLYMIIFMWHKLSVEFSRALVKISCPMDLHKFPLDQQTCFLNFSSCK